MLIDTHSHLYDEAFNADRREAVKRAIDNGVGRIVLPAIDSVSHNRLLSMCREFPGVCFPLMGLHPTSVNDNPDWQSELDIVRSFLVNSATGAGPKVYGVGEVGMDMYWSRDYAREQEEAFRQQIEWAVEFDLPLVIHTREAWPEMREIISSYRGDVIKGILHSFSGTLDDYLFLLECGDFYFGIGGPVTYKKSQLAEILPFMDLTRMVLETDSPYLPPVPYRGKRNESSYIPIIRNKVAELLGKPVSEVEDITTANALRIFGI
ncbi:MAG: TatD family hydrolase [Alistipes sp.]|nr:TatD family hydrolase [Alistipes sp.]